MPSLQESVVDYVCAVAAVALDAPKESVRKALDGENGPGTNELLATFISDAQQTVMCISHSPWNPSCPVGVSLEISEQGASNDDDTEAKEAALSTNRVAPSVVFIKSRGRVPIEPHFSLASQLRFLVLGFEAKRLQQSTDQTDSPDPADSATSSSDEQPAGSGEDALESIYTYVHNAFNPLLRSYTYRQGQAAAAATSAGATSSGGAQTSGSAGDEKTRDLKRTLPVISKRLNELEFALQSHLQNIDIPEVHLQIDPTIASATRGATKVSVQDMGLDDLLEDNSFLNGLQNGVNKWVKEIQRVTRLEHEAGSGTVAQEIQFWHSLERALQHIQDQVESVPVQATLEVLKHTRRSLATILFESDTGIASTAKRVTNCMQLMRNFPIDSLLSASDIPQLTEAIVVIFNHLKKIKTADEYPLTQVHQLVEVLSRDMTNQVLSILSSRRLMHLSFDEFEELAEECHHLFSEWDSHHRQFRELLRDLAKRRGGERITTKPQYEHPRLQDRVEELHSFRSHHEKLRDVITRVLADEEGATATALTSSAGSASPVAAGTSHGNEADEHDNGADGGGTARPHTSAREISAAYKLVLEVDPLDVTREGVVAWESTKKRYEQRIDRIESKIIERLTDRLGGAKTADEMFRVFSKFNALFFRHRIRGAIQQFQARLIGTVEKDIEALQAKFKRSYANSEVSQMSQLRDVPPVSGAIIWAKQIERQLQTYLKRVEAVLGKGWEQHIDGKRLKETGQAFLKKLNTQKMFDQWMSSISDAPSFEVTGSLFAVEERRGGLYLRVNFDPQIVELFKEVRNLQWLGFRVTYTLRMIADEAKEKYPFATSLTATLKTYQVTLHNMDPSIRELLAAHCTRVQETIEMSFNKAKGINWDSDNLKEYSRDLSVQVVDLQEKASDASAKSAIVEECIQELESCPFDASSFQAILARLQVVTDELNLASYSNLDSWVAKLDDRIRATLQKRLELGVRGWMVSFKAAGTSQSGSRVTDAVHVGSADENLTDEDDDLPHFVMQDSVHQVALRKHALYLEPSLETIRVTWYDDLHQCIDTICSLPRIQSARYDDVLQKRGATDFGEVDSMTEVNTHAGLLSNMPLDILQGAYELIEDHMGQVKSYVQTWLQYQALWDMQASDVLAYLGEDFELWLRLLHEIRLARKTFDTAEREKRFGPIVVNYQQVQAQVNLRYDAWHQEMLAKFVDILGTSMKQVHQSLTDTRTSFERASLSSQQTSDIVSFVTLLQTAKTQTKEWQQQVEKFVQGETLVRRQRYSFPSDWLWAANVQGEWEALEQILSRKNAQMEEQQAALQQKVMAKDAQVSSKVKEFMSEWESGRPMGGGNVAPSEALSTLSVFKTKLTKLTEEASQLVAAKSALSIGETSGQSQVDMLRPVSEELESLSQVWGALDGVWVKISQLKETPWNAVVPKKLRVALDDCLEELRQLPSRIRQYEAFEQLQTHVRSLRKSNVMVTDLKSESLKERHWREISKILGLQLIPHNELSLGHIWGDDRLRHLEGQLRDVLKVAQGELALEEFLRQTREYWTGFQLELVNYQNKCKLIRGWEELFSKLDENMNSLFSMKQSPYFAVFEEDGVAWENKLTKLRFLLDIWIDVQRRWVYLSGIFYGSADIKQQLANEYTRFKSIDNEFLALMRKVALKPAVLELLSIPGLERTLNRLADLLEKIQKALGDYLERQRQSFSRFYFVGDEDLLEIIGNAKEPVKVQKHVSKMFAGIGNLDIQLSGEDGNEFTIQSLLSSEGEQVSLCNSIATSEMPRVNEWLQAVESGMQLTLAKLLDDAVTTAASATSSAADVFANWVNQFPAQIVLLATQVYWSIQVEESLRDGNGDLSKVLDWIDGRLQTLTSRVLEDLDSYVRKKYEQLITELVHLRSTSRNLQQVETLTETSFAWLSQMRYRYVAGESNPLAKLSVRMANAAFQYGFEYQGLGERLVQTPLTDRCYLTLTQALHFRLGGNPFGPAGTGKTESVKALGAQLGRFVLVFNCDEQFDLKAMGRIFVGLCQVGAWGCFDEFNRLEERILSAVSQQILNIQQGLLQRQEEIRLLDAQVRLNSNVGIFVTMNPGYAGRSNLPDNLKQLFRGVAMIQPDRELIAQVMLYSQGFSAAESLAGKIVMLFQLCSDQLSEQPHYDFGLRAVKSVLQGAGNLKRVQSANTQAGDNISAQVSTEELVLIQSACETIYPKLVSEDIGLFNTILQGVFPGTDLPEHGHQDLMRHILDACREHHFEPTERWTAKLLQLYQVQQLRHGIMLVGPSGTGKSSAWRILLQAIERLSNDVPETADRQQGKWRKCQSYVIDPKAMSKEELYGRLDSTTLEWSDGVFTHILRKILANVRGEEHQLHWIVFDGDVDPEWAENLNSVLDDNKILTLPNGERLKLPSNIRILIEVESLKYATLASVSRCGMVWFSHDTLPVTDIFQNRLKRLSSTNGASSITAIEEDQMSTTEVSPESNSTPARFVRVLQPYFASDELADKSVAFALSQTHIMDVEALQMINSLFALLARGIGLIVEYDESHMDFPVTDEQLASFATKWLLFSIVWGLGGSMAFKDRITLADFVVQLSTIPVPPRVQEQASLRANASATRDDESNNNTSVSLLDYEVVLDDAEWHLWKERVPEVHIEPHRVMDTDLVVSTVDTVRHAGVLHGWLDQNQTVILCGPPGSGKTMSLTSVLQALPDFELASLNFSSATTPGLILKTFEQYCEYRPTRRGVVLAPRTPNKTLVVFCDEINLPANDDYGTQRVITFMRQVVEQRGFWRPSDQSWVSVERIQFVGACNPPTDPGRVAMSTRFLRHAPLLFVDYPATDSLRQIYGTFNRALLKLQPPIRAHSESLTQAMVAVYEANKDRFSADMHPHYVYSPRELSRWMRALYEAVKAADQMTVEGLVRLWLHEGFRLFHDRLVTLEERAWCTNLLEVTARREFPGADPSCLALPVMYSNWLSTEYASVDRTELRSHVEARLKTFYEEELNVPLVVFDDVLEHVLRIDRVLRQPLGHLLLVGESGAGKTVLTRFVAWTTGIKVFQIKLSRRYGLEDFDDDLRTVMRRAGCEGERICFIIDESNVLSSAFLERMNALLASGEVPGLFEGDEFASLMSSCKDAAQRGGLVLDTHEELFRFFTRQVQANLHVVFTMNPASSDLKNRAATSPALFNRCVVDWFGDWSLQALVQVAYEFTRNMDIDKTDYFPSSEAVVAVETHRAPFPSLAVETLTHRDAVVDALVHIFERVRAATLACAQRHELTNFLSPRDFLDLIQHFVKLSSSKREELEDQQLHLNIGLDKLQATAEQVEELQTTLAEKKSMLEAKNTEANQTLAQIVNDQDEAKQKKLEAQKLSEELNERNAVVEEQRSEAEAELREAEPALVDAQQAVQNIKKSHLDEIRALNNPPAAVKWTLEAVVEMLGLKCLNWQDIRKVLQRREFIPDIVNFQSETLTEAQRTAVNKMLENPDFVEDKVSHASKACHSLFNWVVSQVKFSAILKRVQPLRDEVDKLAKESEGLMERHKAELEKIEELEGTIAVYKEDYAVLIRETEAIKTEMETVQTKVARSKALLNNLSSERERWESARAAFRGQMQSLVGDTLLSAAFLTFSGFFDHRQRQNLLIEWRSYLDLMGIVYKPELSFVEFLSQPSQRSKWKSHQLPSDELCIENAIILEHYNKFPLVIDPSGQATTFLMNHLSDRRVTKTSFLDVSFMKQLEAALRFGTCLLVEDVENIDPILNPVLNKEIHRTGGRMLVRVGDQEIDYSPSFTLVMTTRNPSFQFAPDLCSRVTFVNFTVTPSSLETQCLSKVLRSERPDIETQRNDILKLQGEYQLRLRELEDGLLEALNTAEGSILEDDSVVVKLETLKREAAEVEDKAAQASTVMEKIEAVSKVYQPLARMCSRTYFATERLTEVHFLYQFSLKFFLEAVDVALQKGETASTSGEAKRIIEVTQVFFKEVFGRVSNGLRNEDQLLFALLLVQIYCDGHEADMDSNLLSTLLRPASSSVSESDIQSAQSLLQGDVLSKTQAAQLASLTTRSIPAFGQLESHIRENSGAWISFLLGDGSGAVTDDDVAASDEHNNLPSGWEGTVAGKEGTLEHTCNTLLLRLIVVNALRPDRLVASLDSLVTSVFKHKFMDNAEISLDHVVHSEVEAGSPLLLCAAPGFDASSKVEALARDSSVKFRAIALGSPDVLDDAEKGVSAAAREGSWIMLKNVHLDPQWLDQLEKKVHALTPHPDFRLFLTAEPNPRLPTNLIRVSRSFLFEPPLGIRASLLRSLHSIPAERMNRGPAERARLYLLLAWTHAVLFERLRYAPVGWSKHYEFSEADLSVALSTIDEWIDERSLGKSHIAPEDIPWNALRELLSQTVYGGRIDNEFDQDVLNSILDDIFVTNSFDVEHPLVVGKVMVPEGTTREHYLEWIESLPPSDPTWLGLSSTAETILLTRQGASLLERWNLLQDHSAGDAPLDTMTLETDKGESTSVGANPSWMSDLKESVEKWSTLVPESIDVEQFEGLQTNSTTSSNPMYRCLLRESRVSNLTLASVHQDLRMLKQVCCAAIKPTNAARDLIHDLVKGSTPRRWSELYSNPYNQCELWIGDLVDRVKQVEALLLHPLSEVRSFRVYLGKLFYPAGFITATRQLAAQESKVSIETLELTTEVFQDEKEVSSQTEAGTGFLVQGLLLEGAGWDADSDCLALTDVVRVEFNTCRFTWRTRANVANESATPVYANTHRRDLLFTTHIATKPGAAPTVWRKRGVALAASLR